MHVGLHGEPQGRDHDAGDAARVDQPLPPDDPGRRQPLRLDPAPVAHHGAGRGADLRGRGPRRDRVHHHAAAGHHRRRDPRAPRDGAGGGPPGPGAAVLGHPAGGGQERQGLHVPPGAARRARCCRWACAASCSRRSTRPWAASCAWSCARPRTSRPPSSETGRRWACWWSRATGPRRPAWSRPTSSTACPSTGSAGGCRRWSCASSRTARSWSAGRPCSRATGRTPASTAAAFTADGWYRTGDYGEIDAKGALRLVGRTRSLIALPNGMNVHPEDVEAALMPRASWSRASTMRARGGSPSRTGRARPSATPSRTRPGPLPAP